VSLVSLILISPPRSLEPAGGCLSEGWKPNNRSQDLHTMPFCHKTREKKRQGMDVCVCGGGGAYGCEDECVEEPLQVHKALRE
jgi:hypothetical protein